MLLVIWEYEVHPGVESAFEQLYGEHGAWAQLFRDQSGFLGTQLLRAERPNLYVSIDRWESALHYDAFLASASDRYAQIDAQGNALTLDERRISRYTTC